MTQRKKIKYKLTELIFLLLRILHYEPAICKTKTYKQKDILEKQSLMIISRKL